MVRQGDLEFGASLCYMENFRIPQSVSYKHQSVLKKKINKTKWTKAKIRSPSGPLLSDAI